MTHSGEMGNLASLTTQPLGPPRYAFGTTKYHICLVDPVSPRDRSEHPKAELSLSHMRHKRCSIQQWWEPERFRVVFFVCVFFGGVGGGGALRPVKIITLILSRVNREVGGKRGSIEKNYLTTHKQNLACLTCDPSWLEPTAVKWRAI